jgi:hypothetical protein
MAPADVIELLPWIRVVRPEGQLAEVAGVEPRVHECLETFELPEIELPDRVECAIEPRQRGKLGDVERMQPATRQVDALERS